MNTPSSSSASSSFLSSRSHSSHRPPPPSAAATASSSFVPTLSRDMEVVRLMEQLCRHMVPSSSSSSSSSSFAAQQDDDPAAAAATTARDAREEEALLRSCLHKLGTCRRPPEAALDEFFTIQHAQRKVRREYEGTGQEERGRALANRLEELSRKLGSPALKNQLEQRWAALHLLTSLGRDGRPAAARVGLGGSAGERGAGMEGRNRADVMDAFVSADLPSASLLYPFSSRPAAAAAAAGASSSSSSFYSTDPNQSTSSNNNSSFLHPAGRQQQQQQPHTHTHLPSSSHALAMAQHSSLLSSAAEGAEAEQALLRDLLYSFQGIDGRLIKFDSGTQTHVLHPSLRSMYGPGMLDSLLHISELGWLFRKVSTFAEKAKRQQREVGLVGQALGHVLQDELTEYYRLIAVLETQLNDQQQQQQHAAAGNNNISLFTTATAAAGAVGTARSGGLTLRRLSVWVEEPLQRLRLIATLCDSLAYVRGGALASVLFAHSQQGDPLARGLVHRVLGRVCVPLFEMLRRWVLEGELVDAYGEFFVAAVKGGGGGEGGGGGGGEGGSDESLWHHRYALRPGMIPRFLPPALAHKILVLGKSINFMRRCCHDRGWSSLPSSSSSSSSTTSAAGAAARHARRAAEETEFSYANIDTLNAVVDQVAAVVNARLLSLLRGEKYQLMTHLRALKKFLTLGQGDFVTCLMDAIGPELSKGAEQVYRHDLTGKLEAALRSSNAQYEQPEILNRVGVRLLQASGGEEGWEVFSLDYQVEAPVSAVVHKGAMEMYGRIFHLLWRVKRVEWLLATSWKAHMMVGHLPMASGRGGMEGRRGVLAGVLQRCNLARREMVHFVSNLSSFMWFEVLEASWTRLESDLAAAPDLDSLIAAHDAYLQRVTHTSFLSPDKAPLLSALQAVLSSILAFCSLHSDLCRDALRVHEEKEEFKRVVEKRTAKGEWGLSQAEEEEEGGREGGREGRWMERYAERVEVTVGEFERACEGLIELLQQQEKGAAGRQAAVAEADAVRFLVFRLDFNLYYTQQRLARGGGWGGVAQPAAAAAGGGGKEGGVMMSPPLQQQECKR